MSGESYRGRFVWHDLMTLDVPKAIVPRSDLSCISPISSGSIRCFNTWAGTPTSRKM